MHSLFAEWDAVAAKLSQASRWLLLFDLDGTLAPIVPHPSQVRLPSQIRVLLSKLSRRPGTTVGVVSGRALKDVRAFVRLPELIYAGNHGLEMWDHHRLWVHPVARKKRSSLRRLRGELSRRIDSIPGAWVEDKDLSLSVHFRQAGHGHHNVVRNAVIDVMAQSGVRREFKVQNGKKVLDIRPLILWNKGSVVKRLERQAGKRTAVLYVGDDLTDEDAFRVVGKKGVAVRVGRKSSTAAQYYLNLQREVKRLLKELVKL